VFAARGRGGSVLAPVPSAPKQTVPALPPADRDPCTIGQIPGASVSGNLIQVLFDQAEFDLRCEWGMQGLLNLSPISDAAVIVDILSFSTVVDIVVANGAFALPYRWRDDSAAQFAEEKHAHLASTCRSQDAYSLSPASVRAIPAGTALVLPSPNGSTLCLSANHVSTFTACLRNAPAVAAHVARSATRVAVIPAGEHWDDDTLRPCLEDWIGAGAVLSLLEGRRSPEAELAVIAFERFRSDLTGTLSRSGSGKELIERGFRCDVELASEYAVSSAVPMLAGDRFVNRSS
jgi:2-phosphosulfolactate phosphatase